jgi:hypothetical protein
MDKGVKEEIVTTAKLYGLDIAEEGAVMLVEAAFALMILLAPKVSKGLGALLPGLIDYIRPYIMAMLDKIDGTDDPGR